MRMDLHNIVNSEDCHKVLETLLKTANFQLLSFQVLNFHNPLQGLIGDHYTLKIEFKQNDKTQSEEFFVKTLSNNPFMFNFSKVLQVYEKEAFYYKLLQEYEKYNIDTSFAPKGLFFKPYITILEDLSKKFKGTPKRKFLDLQHCQSSLEVLAKFHASSIIYESRRSEELGKKFSLFAEYPKELEDHFASKEETPATKWLQCAVGGLFCLIDLIPENHITNEEFKDTLMELLADDGTIDGLINGILHADLWTSNFLHCYEDGKPLCAKLLDFQLVKYGPLEEDVMQFLLTNTDRAFREENHSGLVEFYFRKLEESVSSAGVECSLPNFKEFLASCDNFKVPAKIHSVVDHSYTFLGDEIYGEVLQTDESVQKFMFEDRGKYVMDAYHKNEQFRKVLLEDVLELRDLLFP